MRCFPEKFKQLTKSLHDPGSRRSRPISTLLTYFSLPPVSLFLVVCLMFAIDIRINSFQFPSHYLIDLFQWITNLLELIRASRGNHSFPQVLSCFSSQEPCLHQEPRNILTLQSLQDLFSLAKKYFFKQELSLNLFKNGIILPIFINGFLIIASIVNSHDCQSQGISFYWSGREKLRGQLATQIFHFSAHSASTTILRQKLPYFNDSRQICLNFWIYGNACSLSGPLWLTLALSDWLWLSLAHSCTFWLILTQSGSLWLIQALIGLHVVAVWPQFILPGYWWPI